MSGRENEAPGLGEDATLLSAARRSWWQATLLAVAALACGVLLGGLSAWFLGAVALAGLSTATALVFNFHVPGALVRLLAIGRTAARYGERLMGHRAALSDQVLRRGTLFRSMSALPEVRTAGWQLGDPSRLSDYLDDVEDLDYGHLRADLPALSTGVVLATLLVATLFVAPLAALPILVIASLCARSARSLAGHAASMLAAARQADRNGAAALGAAMAAIVPLRAERVLTPHIAAALDGFREGEAQKRMVRQAQARLDTLTGLIGPFGAASVMAAAWLGGAVGASYLVPVFTAFAWLALSEALQNVSRLLIAHLRRRLAHQTMQRWSGGAATQTSLANEAPGQEPTVLDHAGLQRIAPDGRQIGKALPVSLSASHPTIIVGASGSGKTSLLKQIGGWIGDDPMTIGNGMSVSADARRAIATLCLHDAGILSDTVRANLFARDVDDVSLWQALDSVEMSERVDRAGGLDGWITQEALSLGEAQRLNLARAILSPMPLILLDEPTEHLDEVQARRIVRRLVTQLSSRILVISTHHATMFEGVNIVDLDAARH